MMAISLFMQQRSIQQIPSFNINFSSQNQKYCSKIARSSKRSTQKWSNYFTNTTGELRLITRIIYVKGQEL
jgi:hypothetical protein